MKRIKIVVKICSMVAKIMILLRSFEQHYKTDNLVIVILFSWLGPQDFEGKKIYFRLIWISIDYVMLSSSL